MAPIQHSNSLSTLFENLKDPSHCARSLLGASQTGILDAQDAHGFKNFWAAITHDLNFWESLLLFLFKPRSESEARAFLDKISHCSCHLRDKKIREYHRFGRIVEQEIFSTTSTDVQTPSSTAFIINLFRILTSTLENTRMKAVAKRTALNWPTCPEDLMPFGPDNLIESLIVWSQIVRDPVVFRVATQCIRFCGALFIPSVINSSLTRHVVDSARDLFDHTLSTLRLRAETRRKEMGRAFTYQSEVLLGYFTAFCENQPIAKRMIMYNSFELKAMQVFAMLAYLADDPRLLLEARSRRSSTARLAYQAVGIYKALIHYIDPLPPVRLYPVVWDVAYDKECIEKEREAESKEIAFLDSQQDPSLSVFDPEYEVPPVLYDKIAKNTLYHIRIARFDLQCSAQLCTNSIHSTGRQFQRCGRCNIALYCCKECQTESWSAQQFPHKFICKILRRMVDIAGAEVVFSRSPVANYHGYCPDEVGLAVAETWRRNKVPMAELLQVSGWASHKPYPTVFSKRKNCAPGYADYEELINELSSREGATEALFIDMEKPMSSERYNELRLTFNNISKSGTPEVTAVYEPYTKVGLGN